MGRLRILHVVAGLDRAGAGVSESVVGLATAAAQNACDVTVATVLGKNERIVPSAERATALGVRLLTFALSRPWTVRFSLEMLLRLRAEVAAADVVHVHSNWTFPVWWACHLALKLGRPLIMTPHGCLNPRHLEVSLWRKRCVGRLLDRRFLRASAVVHVTSRSEADAVSFYMGACAKSRIMVVPWGIDVDWFVERQQPSRGQGLRKLFASGRVVFYLGRLHPIKGIDLLVDAWRQVARDDGFERGGRDINALGRSSVSDWHLVIAGDGDPAYREQLIERARHLGLSVGFFELAASMHEGREVEMPGSMPDVLFVGPLYGSDRVEALHAASLFVLPALDENFGLVVAESLACGVPVITTKGAPWPDLQGVSAEERPGNDEDVGHHSAAPCGWWVDVGVDPLARALCEALALSDEQRHAMGERGRRLVLTKYTSAALVAAINETYRWALARRKQTTPARCSPSCV